MSNEIKLLLLKLLHTLIWAFYNVVIFYFLYAAVANRIDIWAWICLGLIILEGLILLIFKNVCPVTMLAQKYSPSDTSNFDIFLPEWLAKYNKEIYSGIVLIAVIIIVFRLIL